MDSLYTTIEVANEKGKLSAIIHAFTSIFWTFEFVPPLLRTLYSWSYGTDHIVFTGDKALDLAKLVYMKHMSKDDITEQFKQWAAKHNSNCDTLLCESPFEIQNYEHKTTCIFIKDYCENFWIAFSGLDLTNFTSIGAIGSLYYDDLTSLNLKGKVVSSFIPNEFILDKFTKEIDIAIILNKLHRKHFSYTHPSFNAMAQFQNIKNCLNTTDTLSSSKIASFLLLSPEYIEDIVGEIGFDNASYILERRKTLLSPENLLHTLTILNDETLEKVLRAFTVDERTYINNQISKSEDFKRFTVNVIGHSMGSALATITVAYLNKRYSQYVDFILYAYAPIAFYDSEFMCNFDGIETNIILNENDIVSHFFNTIKITNANPYKNFRIDNKCLPYILQDKNGKPYSTKQTAFPTDSLSVMDLFDPANYFAHDLVNHNAAS